MTRSLLLYDYLSALLLIAVIFALFFIGCGLADAWYRLIVENRSKEAVVVSVDVSLLGWRHEIVDGCSTRNLGQISFRPGEVVEGVVRDFNGRIVLTIEASPELREGTWADWNLEVIVPGATDDEC